ncbi:type II toxin-antitoxin system RelE/ParE family toxin [Rhodocaloribacter litoris]|uniref:type II toxin-antitoxin system RelE/ParE family toxin n=1 Tax=Rhodocaloribacter litoris TaxID=2558931 RepID=UPI001E55254A|nr:type II toxin-antitoxin system RelE/ParE family toxin [Rhodocaloribacter litoris]QXD17219.1 type II toxin-antitoxin system RelE/ParE family toxin [Rhodocaloribacter litoris]
MRNSDAQRGKSGGYRMLYYLKTPERIILVTIYSKTEQGDITAEEVRRIIRAHEAG